ncbi:MAG TPA: diiron oxygenase [Xanthobacteraceae bacterium]|nr:diiron oxygenase [Xanthobacteraceae bacterium]
MWDIGHCGKETADAVSTMPAQQSRGRPGAARGAGEDAPKWRLADWSTAATVRSVAGRRLADKDRGLPFSPELVPLMNHELVRNRDDAVQRMILGQKLHSYFRFTTHLELKAVLPACTMIGLTESVVRTSAEFAHDGFKIAVDEAHHAYCAEDMKQQLTAITAIRPFRERPPAFLRALAVEQDSLDGKFRQLALLAFTCVSETLITSSLASVPADERVMRAIRDVILDHARDEAKHHLYFSCFMETMWAQLSLAEKDVVGPLFAKFIGTFLSHDTEAEMDWLEAAGFSAGDGKRIAAESYEAIDLRKVHRQASKPTITLMSRFGMLDHAATSDALAAAGLME